MSKSDTRLATLLVDFGYIKQADIDSALAEGSRSGESLRHTLRRRGLLSELRLARAFEEAAGVPLVYLTRVNEHKSALSLLPAAMAFEFRAVPFYVHDNMLRVAMADPLDAEVVRLIEQHTQHHVERYFALEREIDWALATFYPTLNLPLPGGSPGQY